jgi:hypothetical protein
MAWDGFDELVAHQDIERGRASQVQLPRENLVSHHVYDKDTASQVQFPRLTRYICRRVLAEPCRSRNV